MAVRVLHLDYYPRPGNPKVEDWRTTAVPPGPWLPDFCFRNDFTHQAQFGPHPGSRCDANWAEDNGNLGKLVPPFDCTYTVARSDREGHRLADGECDRVRRYRR
jgi:hypothetical protein